MKFIINVVLLIAALYAANWAYNYWEDFKAHHPTDGEQASPEQSKNLPGLPPAYEASLAAAKEHGAVGLAEWLRRYRSAAADPRLAEIELDYVVLLNQSNPMEARRIFATVKQRTPTNSPIYPRVKQLARAYE